MNIAAIRTLRGPNVYAHRPLLVMRLDLQALAGRETRDVPGFNAALLELLPGLHEHRCSRRRPGGFVERLGEGTYFSHVIEHVTLELSEKAGIPAYYGRAIAADTAGVFDIVVEFVNEEGMQYLLRTACALVDALAAGAAYSLAGPLAETRRIVARTELGPSTRAIVEAAERRGFPWSLTGEGSSLVEVGYGRYRRRLRAAISDQTNAVSVDIAGDKQLTKALLSQASIPVPCGKVVRSQTEALAAYEEIRPPVVVKPLDGNQGKGVCLNIDSPEDLARAFDYARSYSGAVLVEEMIHGQDYRVLVVGGKFTAASHRMPAHVTGDGQRTVGELIERTNRDPNRGEGHNKPLTRIDINEIVLENLARQGLTLEAIPEPRRQVYLQQTANLSTGGTASDVTDLIHPDIARACERAARILGLDICGIDLILRDIGRQFGPENGCMIEINAAPGLRMHLFPTHGRRREVGDAIINMLYPPATPGRIPIISITGTNGKTTVTRMIGHMLLDAGRSVGMTTTDGIYINGICAARGDLTGFQSARSVLSDPLVDVAVLETARGGIVRSGLGYDWSDISVITTIQADHVGQDGIRSVEDILHIKSLIAERVREGGTLVLNLDDDRVMSIAELPRVREREKNIVCFSITRSYDDMLRYTGGKGVGYFLRDGWIVEASGFQEERIAHLSMIPATMEGAVRFNVANAMAAAAAARAFGLTAEQIAASLMRFSAEHHNPGRAQLFKVHHGYVLVDYGHNAQAFGAVAQAASMLNCARVTGIIGVPGDRADWIIEEAGRAAARGFQKLVIREDIDLRGRRPGDTPRLLHDAIKREVPGRECCVIPDSRTALETALRDMVDEELVVIFYDEIELVLDILRLHNGVPVQSVSIQRPVLVKTAI